MSLEKRIVSTALHKLYPAKAVCGLVSYLHPQRLQMQVPQPDTQHSELGLLHSQASPSAHPGSAA